MRTKQSIMAFLSITLTSAVCAGNMGSVPAFESASTVMTLSVGPAWSSPGVTQTLILQPDIQKTYQATPETKALADGEFFVGWQRAIHPQLLGQLGLAGALAGNAKLYGNIWEDADPDFNNYTYTYILRHAHVAVKGKLLAAVSPLFQPYVGGSLGVGFNCASRFVITPNAPEEVAAPGFASNSNTAFTYTLEAGLQKALNPHWQVALGYAFADWGNSHLGSAPQQTVGGGLPLAHLYTNELAFSLSYLA